MLYVVICICLALQSNRQFVFQCRNQDKMTDFDINLELNTDKMSENKTKYGVF
jgi:hypothetical protein